MKHYPDVDAYLAESEQWREEIAAIRTLLLDDGFDEEIKWGKPCYGADGDNVLILQEMKDFLAVMFFKGALIDDPPGLLRSQGPNSRAARRFEITSVDQVQELADAIVAYAREAVEINKAGLEVEPAPELELVAELQERLDADPTLKEAFEALTPGRQRGYNLHIGEAKKAETRHRRIDKYVPKILDGKGMHDR